jgi:hypothetical protein
MTNFCFAATTRFCFAETGRGNGDSMKNRGMGIRHPKVRGEWVELRFMMRAIELGLHLNKPWGEVMPYDFVIEHEGRFVRVQVKSTMFKDRGGYSCTVRGSDGPYEGDPFEYLAAYVFQEDLWYIIPAEMVVGQGSIALYPKLKGAKYGPYKEAWHLLRTGERSPGRAERIEACAEEWPRLSLGERVRLFIWGTRGKLESMSNKIDKLTPE